MRAEGGGMRDEGFLLLRVAETSSTRCPFLMIAIVIVMVMNIIIAVIIIIIIFMRPEA